jgi:arylsulfatase A-like enzyme
MKAIMVMFDSLNRHLLPPYGCDWVEAPNFKRLAQKTVTFDQCYIGSMPCIPARRELHTGRCNFLHRSWGPLEPFDDSLPEILKKGGVYTHLVSDHGHYWEDGGGTYHNRYNSWEIFRGQEGDPWKGDLRPLEIPPHLGGRSGLWGRQDWVNRRYLQDETLHPQNATFQAGLEFIRTNYQEDHWFLQIETFDPHEPFFSYPKYRQKYPHVYQGPHFDWPEYGEVTESPEQVQHCRYEYAAVLSMADANLGRVLDLMDSLDLWSDTLLIVNTDHGFLLSEHHSWGKIHQPFYQELAHTPLFIWDPRCGKKGTRCPCLVQLIDLAPTLLDYFGMEIPPDMQGKSLKEVIAAGRPVRQTALFGIHGGHVNCTDGRYVYMRAPARPDNAPLYEYTLMPTHMRNRFTPEELQVIELADPFPFTKGCRLLKIKAEGWHGLDAYRLGTLLFDLKTDPDQENPIKDPALEQIMIAQLIRLMRENDAPAEQFERLGLVETPIF